MKTSVALVVIVLSMLVWTCDYGDTTKNQGEKQFMEKGSSATKAVGSTLIKTVQQKMAEGGVEAAVGYCNINALAITESVAQAQGVRVKRTALKTRNPENNPSKLEREVLTKMSSQKKPESEVVFTDDNEAVFFQPIMLQAFCQTCHGTPGETMTVETNELIRSHYPEDEATGFSEGELRGMWAVYFETPNN